MRLPPSDQAPSRKCVGCGNPLPERAMVCPLCGHDYRAVLRGTRHTKTPFPEIGGAAIATAGVFQVIMGLVMMTNEELATELLDMNLQTGVVYVAVAAALLAVGPLVVLGGALAMQRRSLALSTIGAVLATGMTVSAILYGTAGIIGTVFGLGLVGLILIVASKDEFTS